MKKIIIKSILALSILGTTYSCREELLEPYIPGSLTEEQALTDVSDLAGLLNGVYSNINSRTESVDVSILTDEVGIGFANGGQGLGGLYDFNLLPTSSIAGGIWSQSYVGLSKINRFFKYVDIITPKNDEETNQLNVLRFQAHTLRAYLHLRLMAYYSTDLTDNSALAGVLADRFFTVEESASNTRATNGEFYNLIHQDLDDAITLLTSGEITELGDASKNTIANPKFVMGLKARAYSYQEDYVNAEVFANLLKNSLPLCSPQEYSKIFHEDDDAVTNEVVFQLKRQKSSNSQGYNLHNGWCSLAPNLNGSPFFEISRALFNKLDDNDARKGVIVSPTSIVDPNYQNSPDYLSTDKLIIAKHGGGKASTGSNRFNNNIKVMRVAEMYFILAEAKAASGDFAGVKSILDQLRMKRYTTVVNFPTITNSQEAWKAILDEKRIEFAYEGYRYIDLKRLANKANVSLDRDAADYANYPTADPFNMSMDSFKWTLPIPQVELNSNSVIEQNPGY